MKKFINQKDMKQTNIADIFGLIRKSGRVTRRQLADKTGMSWGAVSTITARLIEEGYVVEVKSEEIGVGRTPYYLEVDGTRHFSLGIDVNKSGFRGVLMNLKNEVVSSVTGSGDFSDRESLIGDICRFTERALEMADGRHVICIGVAMQGTVDAERGISISMSGCKGWEDVPLAYILEGRFGLPVHIKHDPNCILYALQGMPRRDTVLIRVDNGIGMAVMMGGKIIDKPGIFELGHTVVDPLGEKCFCGRCGCLELYASRSGLERLTGESFEALAARAEGGDADAQKRFSDMGRYLAYAISGSANLLNIDSVVLCGEMCDKRELFYGDFEKQMRLCDPDGIIEISFTDVGNAALGAAMLAARIALKQINTDREQNEN